VSSVDLRFREDVLLYLLRALWGVITPDIRAIRVSWGNGVAGATFVYDHPVTEVEWELVREVEAEVVADFPPEVPTDFDAIFVSEQQLPALPSDSWWVYVRREPEL
jgi:hypothetical protein